MNKFLKYCLFFFITTFVIIGSLIILTTKIYQSTADLSIPKSQNILLVGDSHPECAIDDSIVRNVKNLSLQSTGYFYNYLKVREFINKNAHIDTVVLGFSMTDIGAHRDLWFSGDNQIHFQLSPHFVLFSIQDYWELFKANPSAVIYTTCDLLQCEKNTFR